MEYSRNKGPHTGTTIAAVAYEGGVVLGADSRVSTGTYVSNRASNKIAELCDNVYLCRSGSAADTEIVSHYGKYYIDLHKSEIQKYASVKSVASIINQLSYNNKGLMAAMIVGGWDEKEGGQVFSNPIGGTLVQVPWAVEGSGSSYIWSYFDDEYKTGMTKEETEKFIVQGIALAMARDGSSGGVIRLVTVDKEGAKKQVFQGEDIPLAYEDMPEPSVPQQVVW